MESTHHISPTLSILTDPQKDKIHNDSLRVLSAIGVRVESETARKVVARKIGSTAVEGDIVRIPPEVVEAAIKTAPSAIEIYDRRGNPAFEIPGKIRFGIGVTDLYYQEPENDKIVPFTREHMVKAVRLGHSLPNYDAICTIGIPHDLPIEVLDVYSTLDMVANTTKPLAILVSEDDALLAVIELLEELHGDLASKPFIMPFFTPIAPLVINAGTSDKMMVCIERGLPFIYSAGAIAGASAPVMAAESLCQLNAQVLAGVTLSQLIKEGTPILAGFALPYLDMKGMGLLADTNTYLVNLISAEMMAHYHLPHYGISGSAMGWGADLINASHQWMNHLTSCMGKVGLALFVGSVLGFKVFSPTAVVHASEIIDQARRLAAGITYDAHVEAFDEIAQAGPGGSFLASDFTFQRFRQAYYSSNIFPELTFEKWQAQGCLRAEDLLREYTNELMANLSPPDDHDDLMERGEAFIQKMGPM